MGRVSLRFRPICFIASIIPGVSAIAGLRLVAAGYLTVRTFRLALMLGQ
jgi:hypothetical protein